MPWYIYFVKSRTFENIYREDFGEYVYTALVRADLYFFVTNISSASTVLTTANRVWGSGLGIRAWIRGFTSTVLTAANMV